MPAVSVRIAVRKRRAARSWPAEAVARGGLEAETVYATVVEAGALGAVAFGGRADAVLAGAGGALW